MMLGSVALRSDFSVIGKDMTTGMSQQYEQIMSHCFDDGIRGHKCYFSEFLLQEVIPVSPYCRRCERHN